MSQDKKYNILEELTKCSGYDIALMTTFNFDIVYFERAILNSLFARGLKKISIFVDANEFSESIKLVTNCHLGRKYMVNPIEMSSSFHPKVALLLGDDRARLIVGSCNLTASGYTTNNEVFNFFDYSSQKQENLDIICTAINMFVEINNLSYKQDNALIREAVNRKYYRKPNKDGDSVLLYNTKSSIIEQTSKIIGQKVKEIKIIVPYYDKQLIALKELKKAFPDAKTHLYLYKYLSTFPTETNSVENIADSIDVFEGFNDNNQASWNNFYHGKVFIFKCVNADYALYGSANCTQSALVRTKTNNGNIECDCLEKGSIGEFDCFTENIRLSDDKEYTTRSATQNSTHSDCFSFKYGKYEDGIKLHFGYTRKPSDIIVLLGENELQHSFSDDDLSVTIPSDLSQTLPTIFDVQFAYEEKEEMVRCWVYNPQELDNFRYSTLIADALDDVDIDSDGDKFTEDYTKLIDAMNSCIADIEANTKMVAMHNILQQENEERDVDEAEDDDFIIEDNASDVDQFEYRRFSAVERFRKQFLRRFILGGSSLFYSSRSRQEISKTNSEEDIEQEDKKPRKATTAEKRFEKFVKKRIKEIFNPAYLSIISVEHYIGIMEVVFEIFKKYCNTDPVEDIFDIEYVIKTRIEFYMNLLTKELKDTENLSNLEETVIINCFAIMIENRTIDNSYETENANRTFLSFIENKYHLRDLYRDYVKKAIERDEVAVVQKGYEKSCDYIDMLYGYKSKNLLIEAISKIYNGAQVEITNKILKIKADVVDINQHGVPNKEVLAEIGKYSYKYEPVSTVIIEVFNVADLKYVKNVRIRIKHTIRMESHQWICETEYRYGSIDKSKSRYYDF